MDLSVKHLSEAVRKGGVWILLTNHKEMKGVIFRMKNEENTDIQAIRCETVDDAVRAKFLIEAFNTWTLEGIKEFMASHKNFPKIQL